MASLEQRFKDFSDKISSKLNQLKTDLGEVIPWKGLSPNNGQSLTTDTEGRVYFKERTPEEIAQAYESLTDRNRFSNAHKATVESFEGQFLSLENKLDKGGNTTDTAQSLRDDIDLKLQQSTVIAAIDAELGNENWKTGRTLEEIQDIVGAMFQAGTHTNITVEYDDVNGTINLTGTSGGTGTSLTEEEVEDIVGGLATQGTGINVFYDDANDALVVSLSGESFTTAHKNKLEATEIVTQSEKNTWNAKQDALGFTPADASEVTKTIGTLIELRQYEGYTGEAVEVLGRGKKGDGLIAPFPFVWSETSEETDNDATIIAVDGVTVGRWKVDIQGGNVEWFGAEAKVGFDSTNAFQAMADALGYIGVPERDTYFEISEFISTRRTVISAIDGNAYLKLIDTGNFNAGFYFSHVGSGIKEGVIIDANGTSRTPIILYADNCFSYAEIKNLSADLDSGLVSGLRISGDNIKFNIKAENFSNTGNTNGSVPRLLTIDGTSTNYHGSINAVNAVCGVCTSSTTGFGKIDILDLTDLFDNGIYHLGGNLDIGTMIYNGSEEGIVVSSGKVSIGTYSVRGDVGKPIAIQGTGDIKIGNLFLDREDTLGVRTIINLRDGVDEFGSVHIDNISGSMTSGTLIGIPASAGGSIEHLRINSAKIKYYYEEATTEQISRFVDMDAVKSYYLKDFHVDIIDTNDVLTSSDVFYIRLPENVNKKSFFINPVFEAYGSDGLTFSSAQIRTNNLLVPNVFYSGIGFSTSPGTFGRKHSYAKPTMGKNTFPNVPTYGFFREGDIFYKSFRSAGDPLGWIVKSGGTFGIEDPVFASFSLDEDLIHKTGDETKTGKLTIDDDFDVTGLAHVPTPYKLQNRFTRILNPKGGSGGFNTNSITGAIKVKLPVYQDTASMLTIKLCIYDHSSSNRQIDAIITGYLFTDGVWSKESAKIITDDEEMDLNIRFGNDGVSACIWIGDLDKVWSYPRVSIDEIVVGYIGASKVWAENWALSFVTSFDNVATILTNNLPTSDFDKMKNKPEGLVRTPKIISNTSEYTAIAEDWTDFELILTEDATEPDGEIDFIVNSGVAPPNGKIVAKRLGNAVINIVEGTDVSISPTPNNNLKVAYKADSHSVFAIDHNGSDDYSVYGTLESEGGDEVPEGQTLTGTEIDLSNVVGNNYNYASPSSAETYTFVNPVINGFARCFIDAANEPTVTGANKIGVTTFLANTEMELVIESPDGTNVEYYFVFR